MTCGRYKTRKVIDTVDMMPSCFDVKMMMPKLGYNYLITDNEIRYILRQTDKVRYDREMRVWYRTM